MNIESEGDLSVKQKAIQVFVSKFKGSFEKLSSNDVDYKVYDSNGDLISYADIIVCEEYFQDSTEISLSMKKLIKLSDKRLNPVMIWAFKNCIAYCKTKFIVGHAVWIKKIDIPEIYSPEELYLILDNKQKIKIIKL